MLRVLDCNAASAPRLEDEHIARVASLCSMTAGGSFSQEQYTHGVAPLGVYGTRVSVRGHLWRPPASSPARALGFEKVWIWL